MPQRPRRLCEHPGCGATSSGERRYCKQHHRETSRAPERERGSACKRGYGRRWEKLRKIILARDPLCHARANALRLAEQARRVGDVRAHAFADLAARCCSGMRPSTDVDHLVRRNDGGDDSEANLQGTCHECHSIKTAMGW